MKVWIVAAGVAVWAGAAAPVGAATVQVVEGTWSARFADEADDPGEVRVSRWEDEARWGRMQATLDDDATRALRRHAEENGGVVALELRRTAGTLSFEGRVRSGRGSGTFTFEEDPAFRREMATLGMRSIDAEEAFAAALHGVGPEQLRRLRATGFDPDFDDLMAAAIFEVDEGFAREARSAGWDDVELDDLVAMRIHGVTRAWVDAMGEAGLEPEDLDQAMAFRIHGVTPDFAREARSLGLGPLDGDDLVAMRIHGIDARWVADARAMGFGELDFDDVVAMKIHGVRASWLEELADEGFVFDDVDDALSFRVHGITAAYVRELEELGFEELEADDVLRIKIQGLDRLLRRRRR